MKVSAVLEGRGRKKLSPLQQKVLGYLEEHADEVFTYRDAELATKLPVKPSTLGFTLWALHQRNLIDKVKVGGKVYFGSHAAIAQLKRRADETPKEDWFERANRLREEIFQKHGYINVLELLDEVREGR